MREGGWLRLPKIYVVCRANKKKSVVIYYLCYSSLKINRIIELLTSFSLPKRQNNMKIFIFYLLKDDWWIFRVQIIFYCLEVGKMGQNNLYDIVFPNMK